MAVTLALVVAYPTVVAFGRAVLGSVDLEVLAVPLPTNLPLTALGALKHHLVGSSVALCVQSLAKALVGGKGAGGTLPGLLSSFAVQDTTSVNAKGGPAIATGQEAGCKADICGRPRIWPPQFLAPMGHCGAAPIKAVAPWAGCPILLESILRAHWLLAITELIQVTPVLCEAAPLTSWLHPALMAAVTMCTLSPFSQLAGSSIAAGVLTLLWDNSLSSCTWGQWRLQGRPAPTNHPEPHSPSLHSLIGHGRAVKVQK